MTTAPVSLAADGVHWSVEAGRQVQKLIQTMVAAAQKVKAKPLPWFHYARNASNGIHYAMCRACCRAAGQEHIASAKACGALRKHRLADRTLGILLRRRATAPLPRARGSQRPRRADEGRAAQDGDRLRVQDGDEGPPGGDTGCQRGTARRVVLRAGAMRHDVLLAL